MMSVQLTVVIQGDRCICKHHWIHPDHVRYWCSIKWSIELRFIYSNSLLRENTEIAKGGRFFCTFLSIVNTLAKKISIINSHYLLLVSSDVFNSSVAFDANFLRSFHFIPSKILRKLSLLFFGGNVAMWAN